MKNNTFNKNRLSILIGLLMGIFLLDIFSSNIGSEINFEEFALGKNTKTLMASVEDKKIHCNDLKNLNLCIEGYKIDKNNDPVILSILYPSMQN